MADKDIVALTNAATVVGADLAYVVRDVAGTPVDRKVTLDVLATLINATATGAVTSVFSRTGVVVAATNDYTKAQVGLSNVDNTTDAGKPVSTAGQTALDLKSNLASPTFTGTITTPAVGVSYVGSTSGTTAIRAAAVAGTTIVTMPGTTGTMALTADITGTNSGTNTGDNATNTQYSGLAASKADLASPTCTGTPAGPAAPAVSTNTTQLATTAFVFANNDSDGSVLATQVFG